MITGDHENFSVNNSNKFVSEKRYVAGYDFRWGLLPSGPRRAGRVRKRHVALAVQQYQDATAEEEGEFNDEEAEYDLSP